MDISQAGDEVAVDIDEPSLVAPLEGVACCAKLPMAVSRVSHGDALHELAKRLIVDLHERVKMVRHPAERVQSCKTATEALGDDVVEHIAISGRREEFSAVVSAQDDMIEAAGHM